MGEHHGGREAPRPEPTGSRNNTTHPAITHQGQPMSPMAAHGTGRDRSRPESGEAHNKSAATIPADFTSSFHTLHLLETDALLWSV